MRAEGSPIRVVIVDDSLVAREMLAQILASDPEIEVVGQAQDGREGVELVAKLSPDLVTMDIHMPRMDGLQAVEHIMAFTPTPILVVSSSVHGAGIGRAFDALEAGALEVMKKPEPRDWEDLQRIGIEIIRKVKILSRVRVITHIRGRRKPLQPSVSYAAPVPAARPALVAIGSSTGGPSALLEVLGRLSAEYPLPIVIAQHIADGFIPGLVSWLDSACRIRVKAAEDGEPLVGGVAYLAPTGRNVEVDGDRLHFVAALPGQLYIPSADTLLVSAARTCRARAIGILLTGMGADGALGMKAIREVGGYTIAQDEGSSTVFGMPKAAIDIGAAQSVLPLTAIAAELERLPTTV